jgi:predicted lipoprotein with Yx(FWY)xxD motif
MKTRISVSCLVALTVFLSLAAAGFAGELKIMKGDKVGSYLADSAGMTLYYFKPDSPDNSQCMGNCLENWPVFYDDNITPPPGLEAKDFGSFTRPDGKKQSTFRGYPLYYFAGDKKPGDTKGNGLGGVWRVIHPDTFMK